jgi:hypothetical protein
VLALGLSLERVQPDLQPNDFWTNTLLFLHLMR